MKQLNLKLITFTLLFGMLINPISSQSKTTLPNYDSKTFSWEGGDENHYDVKFTYMVEGDKIPKDVMDNVVMNIMVKSKFQLKNKYSYVPKKLNIYDGEDGKYSGYCEYVGKNSYGTELIQKSYYEIDKEGTVKLLFTK